MQVAIVTEADLEEVLALNEASVPHVSSIDLGAMCWFAEHAPYFRIVRIDGRLAGFLSRNAYAAYLIHEVVIVAMAYAVRPAEVYPLLKWALVSAVALPLCFALSSLIRKLPYADCVL